VFSTNITRSAKVYERWRLRNDDFIQRQWRSQTFSFGGALEGPILQQGELSMVCVGLSEIDLQKEICSLFIAVDRLCSNIPHEKMLVPRYCSYQASREHLKCIYKTRFCDIIPIMFYQAFLLLKKTLTKFVCVMWNSEVETLDFFYKKREAVQGLSRTTTGSFVAPLKSTLSFLLIKTTFQVFLKQNSTKAHHCSYLPA